jgi:hypothetical protein
MCVPTQLHKQCATSIQDNCSYVAFRSIEKPHKVPTATKGIHKLQGIEHGQDGRSHPEHKLQSFE